MHPILSRTLYNLTLTYLICLAYLSYFYRIKIFGRGFDDLTPCGSLFFSFSPHSPFFLQPPRLHFSFCVLYISLSSRLTSTWMDGITTWSIEQFYNHIRTWFRKWNHFMKFSATNKPEYEKHQSHIKQLLSQWKGDTEDKIIAAWGKGYSTNDKKKVKWNIDYRIYSFNYNSGCVRI